MKKLLTIIGLAAISLAGVSKVSAQSQLSAGDLMFVQLSSDSPDTFGFVFTKDIAAGTSLVFTDNAWDSTDFWRLGGTDLAMTEGSFVWTAASAISAGTITTINSHNLGLAASGDNLFAIQGSWLSPNFISGATWDQTGTWLTTGSASTNNSYLPSTLTDGTTAFGRGAAGDNTGYTGATTNGTTAALRTAIYGTPANWTTNNSTLVTPTAGPYTFTDATAAAAATSTVAFYSFGVDAAGYSDTATKVNGTNGSEVSFGSFADAQVVSGGTLVLDTNGKNGFNNQGYATENTSSAFGTSSTLSLTDDAAFEFTLTVNAGFSYDLENVSFFALRNADGPQNLALYFSHDSGSSWTQLGSDLALTGTTWQTYSFEDSLNSFSDWEGTVDFRVYAWNAANATGQQFLIDEIYTTGSVVVPEPATCALVGLGLAVNFLRRRRSALV